MAVAATAAPRTTTAAQPHRVGSVVSSGFGAAAVVGAAATVVVDEAWATVAWTTTDTLVVTATVETGAVSVTVTTDGGRVGCAPSFDVCVTDVSGRVVVGVDRLNDGRVDAVAVDAVVAVVAVEAVSAGRVPVTAPESAPRPPLPHPADAPAARAASPQARSLRLIQTP
jgi:hypothetical protein